jgi:ferrous iron transport protein B
VAGVAIFMLVVGAVFQTMFKGARPLMEAVQAAIQTSGQWIGSLAAESGGEVAGGGRNLERCGIGGGFSSADPAAVLFIGVLEDSGYLARAALIADRTMARFGLQGKSFIPLLSAYACAVPAIMATRTIENKRDRIATILIAPFMTCSARLPVYTLVIAAFIPDKPLLGALFGMQTGALLGCICWDSWRRSSRHVCSNPLCSRARARRSCWRCRRIAGPRCGR